MRLRVPTELWAASLLATLGVAPVACGGRAETDVGDDGEEATAGKNSTGGSTAGTGGTSATGGSAGRGGTAGEINGTGGSSAGRGGTSGGTGAIGNNPFPCESPTPVVDETSGYVECGNGFIARPVAASCPSELPRAEPIPNYDPVTDFCQYDSECTEKSHGYCGLPPYAQLGQGSESRSCRYGCVSDSECDSGYICLCGDPVGRCVEATCTSDADCGPGLHCASHDPTNGCGFVGFACQTSSDECVSAAACDSGVCMVTSNGSRECSTNGCAIGRPFLVHDEARMAVVMRRSDWMLDSVRPSLAGLDAALREQLATNWLHAARLEHASIAAFGRFLLELLAFGAPAELVSLTIQAMDDERRHAELCFALASEYAGVPLGPAELDLEGALPTVSLDRSLVTAIREGCIGETVAALEAAELGERVSDPVLRSVLTRIAADEKRHAELAFHFVEWVLSAGGDDAHAIVESEMARIRSELASLPRLEDPASSELARLGLSSDGLSLAVRRAALESAVLPGLEGLLLASRPRRAA